MITNLGAHVINLPNAIIVSPAVVYKRRQALSHENICWRKREGNLRNFLLRGLYWVYENLPGLEPLIGNSAVVSETSKRSGARTRGVIVERTNVRASPANRLENAPYSPLV